MKIKTSAYTSLYFTYRVANSKTKLFLFLNYKSFKTSTNPYWNSVYLYGCIHESYTCLQTSTLKFEEDAQILDVFEKEYISVYILI